MRLHTVVVKGYEVGTKKKKSESMEIFCTSGEDVSSLARQQANSSIDDIYEIEVGEARTAIISGNAHKELAREIIDTY